jgi:hypothetical protein
MPSIGDILGIVDRILGAQQARKTAVNAQLRELGDLCDALLAADDLLSPDTKLVQARVRSLYDAVPRLLGEHLTAAELQVVVDALAWARVGYWARILATEEPPGVPRHDEAETHFAVGPHLAAKSSLMSLYWHIQKNENPGTDDRNDVLAGILALSLYFVAALHELRMRRESPR